MFLNELFGKNRLKKSIWVVLFQIFLERCSKWSEDILQKFEKFGSKVCNLLHLEKWALLVLNLNLVWFQNKIWKEKGLNDLKNIDLISQKAYSKKDLKMLCKSFIWLQKENENWKLTLFISKEALKLIWFNFKSPKRVHSKWFENKVQMFHLFSKILKIPCLK